MEHLNYTPEELIPIVAELASKYTGFAHSSISYEKAQTLMEAVLYFIHEWEDSTSFGVPQENFTFFELPRENSASPESLTENFTLLKSPRRNPPFPLRIPAASNFPPARDAYLSGREIVLEKVKRLQALYNELIPDFQDYGSEFLRDTIVKGIPSFLLNYDAGYAPQETLLTLDYQILKNLNDKSGIDAVLEYVGCISLEQRFLRKFGISYVTETLRAYHEDYVILTENICVIVLRNLVSHILLNKPLDSVGFTQDEREHMKNLLAEKSLDELKAKTAEILRKLIEHYFDSDLALKNYLEYGLSDIAAGLPCLP